MSLWEAISSIRIQGASRVGRVEDHVIDQRLTLEDIRTKMLEVERLLGELRAHYLENMPKISDHITDFHGRILKLETASKAGVSSSNLFGSISGSLGPNAGFSSPARPAPWVSQTDFEALKKYVSVAFQDIKETLGDLRASGKNSSTLEPLENGFAACTSYDKWVTGAEGYKQVLSNMLTNFTYGVMGPVNTVNNPAITSLAGALMGSLIGQWHNLCTFIDSFYIELTRLAAFNPVSAWQLVGRCVGALFSAMAPYRAPVTMLDEMDNWDARAACVWAVMQCHRVGWAFDLVKYRGHPAVVKEMSLFLLTERVDPSEITACTERSKKAEKDASELKSEMAKLKEVVNSLNREVKTAQGELKNLRNRN
jgi:hypothetical protein